MYKFFTYNFCEESTEQIIAAIETLIEATKKYDRMEDMFLSVSIPDASIEAVSKAFDRKYVKIVTQNFTLEEKGITFSELSRIGIDMTTIGLTCRRYNGEETDMSIAAKMEKALVAGFKAALFVGETEEMAQNGTAAEVITNQILSGLKIIPEEAMYRVGVMYKPLWSCGNLARETDENYLINMMEVIKKAVSKANPELPANIPFAYSGILSAARMIELLNRNVFNGVCVDSTNMSVVEFIDVINKTVAIDN